MSIFILYFIFVDHSLAMVIVITKHDYFLRKFIIYMQEVILRIMTIDD